MKVSTQERQRRLAADRKALDAMDAASIDQRIRGLEAERHNPEADVQFVNARLSLARKALARVR
ncbi:hypothetical protein LCGC14_2953080 [marine sediment metagenome]|uniref:Uncharacterized protein n=1 Tax=marine sediment metagenome TaxID=412755 RepID=A0A0F8XEE6_9ZZZZ